MLQASRRFGFLIACCLVMLAGPCALAITITWTDNDLGNSNWNDPDNWSPTQTPGSLDDVIIPEPLLSPGPAILNVNGFVNTIELTNQLLGNPGSLDMLGGNDLRINGGSLVNDGQVVVNSDEANFATEINMVGGGSITGTGTITLNHQGIGFPTNSESQIVGGQIAHGAGHTITGKGRIVPRIVNDGTILASDPTGSTGNRLLMFGPAQNNNHILGAADGGQLAFQASPSITLFQGPAGVLLAEDGALGGVVSLPANMKIVGGTLDGQGTNGRIIHSTGDVRLEGVTNLGNYIINPGRNTILDNSFTNDGTVTVNGTLTFDTATSLDGTGEVVLANTSLNALGGASVTHAATHTIRGRGTIFPTVINNGVIEADGGGLSFSSDQTNNNLYRASAGASLNLENNRTITQDPASGRILADDGTVNLGFNSPVRIVGGRLAATGTGLLRNSSQLATLEDVTLEQGNMHVVQVNVDGAELINDGTITVNPSGLGGVMHRLRFLGQPDMTLGGVGTVVLNANNTAARVLIDPAVTLTQKGGHTITGDGGIDGAIINEGVVRGNNNTTELIEINGHLSGTGEIGNVQINGTHAPGGSTAIVPATGLYFVQNTGAVEFELGGTTAGNEYDQIELTGTAVLSGIVDLQLINGFIPTIGDTFTLITTTGGVTGTFDTISGALQGPTALAVSYTTSDVLVRATLPGDFDLDNDVDLDDFNILASNFGSTGTVYTDGDADQDDDIDLDDFNLLASNFGATFPEDIGALPEPGTAAVLLIALGGFRRNIAKKGAGSCV